MSTPIRWLHEESRGWVDKGLLTSEQAEQIRKLYPEPKAGLPWGTIIFSGLGAVIAGLGIILVLAYNWQAIPRFGKLAIILAGITGLHAGGLTLFVRSQSWRQLGEAACLLGTMLFGAGIWLVAQAYHIDEHYPNGFLLWGLGALALAWAMPSIAQALLAVVILTIWGCCESWGFRMSVHWAPLLILVGIGSLAWRLRSPVLLFFVLTGFAFALAANVTVGHGDLVARVFLNFGALFVAVALLSSRRRWFPEGAGAWTIFGWIGFLVCVYLLSFSDIVEDVLGWGEAGRSVLGPMHLFYGWVPLLLAVAAWAFVAWPWRPGAPREGRPRDLRMELWLVPLTAVLCQVLALTRLTGSNWATASVFNLVFLAVAASWMARGCREGRLRPTILGSLLLVALVIARYFDLFESLAARGLVFLMVGGLLIAEGILFRRARTRLQTKEVRL